MNFSRTPKHVNNAIQRLSRLGYLKQFSDFEDWVSTEYFNGNDVRIERELEQFNVIYRFVTLEYRKQGYYPSSGFVSEVIFQTFTAGKPSDFFNDFQKRLAFSTATKTSILIFPLQDIGFASHKRLLFLNPASRFYYDGPGFRIIPQTNEYQRTLSAIKDFINGTKLVYKSRLDYSLFEHYRRTRNLKWLEYNPLLLCAFNFTQDTRSTIFGCSTSA